jgi:hypothetical protein
LLLRDDPAAARVAFSSLSPWRFGLSPDGFAPPGADFDALVFELPARV